MKAHSWSGPHFPDLFEGKAGSKCTRERDREEWKVHSQFCWKSTWPPGCPLWGGGKVQSHTEKDQKVIRQHCSRALICVQPASSLANFMKCTFSWFYINVLLFSITSTVVEYWEGITALGEWMMQHYVVVSACMDSLLKGFRNNMLGGVTICRQIRGEREGGLPTSVFWSWLGERQGKVLLSVTFVVCP